jgi:uncharacterized protein YbaA (DUF1428 family)
MSHADCRDLSRIIPFVDAFVMPVTRSREDEYLKLAKNSARIWMDHGALSYVEARG